MALELASEGQPLVLPGFVSDVISTLEGVDYSLDLESKKVWSRPAPEPTMLRRYEDYVLGKLAADMSLERAADELHKYKNRDRDRVLAFAVSQMQQRANLPAVLIGPTVIKALLALRGSQLAREFDAALGGGYSANIYAQWDELIQAVRSAGELLGVEDVFELASGTALSKFGQRLALRQVMQAAQQLVVGLPKQKPTGAKRNYSVATNIAEEDLYPVGGFSSIANRGTMESLLRSELAYMEDGERPDLFDIKYARDELLYYSRDDNQFFRRRVTVMFWLDSSLSLTRVKDAGSPWQRIVLAMATVLAMVRTLTDWLASDALRFEILFVRDSNAAPASDEQALLAMIFQEEIKAGRMWLGEVASAAVRARYEEHARQSLCHCVRVHAQPAAKVDAWFQLQRASASSSPWQPLFVDLSIADPLPVVRYDEQLYEFPQSNEPWREALRAAQFCWCGRQRMKI